MIRIGLTGTVAAGKSTVGDLFEAWGASRVDADRLARQAVAPGSDGLARIVSRFGEDVIDSVGELDRARMRSVVFEDDEARADLEAIVHAEVRRLRQAWADGEIERGVSVLVEEIPLLYETGLETVYDVVVTVDAPLETRRARATSTRGWSAEEFDAIDSAQMDAERKRELSDFVIWNDRDMDALAERAGGVWEVVTGRPPLGSGVRTED